jgi:hypothetical protein
MNQKRLRSSADKFVLGIKTKTIYYILFRRSHIFIRDTLSSMMDMTPTSTCSKSSRRRRKVRFSKAVKVHNSDATQDEMSDTWIPTMEMRHMRNRDAKLARRLAATNDDDTLRSQGLESEAGLARRRVRVKQAQLSVLLAQEQLWELPAQNTQNQTHPESLREIYAEYTRTSAWAAYNSGVICWLQVQHSISKGDLTAKIIELKQGHQLEPEAFTSTPSFRRQNPVNRSRSA